jgi:two-component system CheB/CheR fusion protein
MSGHDVCRTLRTRDNGRQLVIIAITGWNQDSDQAQSKAAGFDAHLVKPVDPREISPLIETLQAQHRG